MVRMAIFKWIEIKKKIGMRKKKKESYVIYLSLMIMIIIIIITFNFQSMAPHDSGEPESLVHFSCSVSLSHWSISHAQ